MISDDPSEVKRKRRFRRSGTALLVKPDQRSENDDPSCIKVADEDSRCYAEDRACQYVGNVVDVKVKTRECDSECIDQSGDAELRREADDRGRGCKRRECVSGREGEVLRFADDDVAELASYLVRAGTLRDSLKNKVNEQQAAAECKKNADGGFLIDVGEVESTGGGKPDDAEVTGQRKKRHDTVKHSAAQVLIDPIQYFQFASGNT